jgi:tetratricopeptide (TPR) repeat protein
MLSAEERYRLLEEASALSARWDLRGVESLLRAVPEQDLPDEPELGHLLALNLYRAGRQREAAELIRSLGSVSKQHSDNLFCRHLLLHGALHVESGNLDAGLDMFAHAGTIAEALPNQAYLALARMNSGVVCVIRCDWVSGLASFRRAVAAYTRLGRMMEIGHCAHNMGMAYREMEQWEVAADSFDLAIQKYSMSRNLRQLSATESERALLFRERGDLALAEAAATRAVRLAVSYNNLRQEGEALRVLGIIRTTQGRLQEGSMHLERALMLARQTDTVMLQAEVFEELAILAQLVDSSELVNERARLASDLYAKLGAALRTEKLWMRLGLTEGSVQV